MKLVRAGIQGSRTETSQRKAAGIPALVPEPAFKAQAEHQSKQCVLCKMSTFPDYMLDIVIQSFLFFFLQLFIVRMNDRKNPSGNHSARSVRMLSVFR